MGLNSDFTRTVLVVDDEEVNRLMLGEILKDSYDVMYAENGADAAGRIKAWGKKISLVLLDLRMPEMDGYGVLEIMREDSVLSKIPVIVLTSEKSEEVKSLKAGAVDFLTKPYDAAEVILARISRSIQLAEDSSLIQSTERDSLTGLYSKDFFFQYAASLAERRNDKLMDAIVLELSNFHFINELYGREFGNKVLKTIATDIQQLADEDDGLAGRCGENIFYLYTAQHWNYDKPLDRISYHLSELLKETEIQLHMGLCKGMYLAKSLEQRFDRALHACLSLRDSYGVGFAIYSEEMHRQELMEARILADFPEALEKKQFKVFYQPKVDIRGDVPFFCSSEALVKWEHPEFGLLQPDSFIPQFEKNGLIQKLDRYVWSEVARQMQEWKAQGRTVLPVSVNVSRVDMNDPSLTDFLCALVSEHQIPPEQLHLEVTESAYIQNRSIIVQTVKKLREAGFKIEMDDFGSGYSSLNMLSVLPIDALKLDIEFIRNIETDKIALYMVRVVLELARNFKIPVIAEGVETEAQYRLLKKAGCDIVQGFYFSKAVPPDEFIQLSIQP